MDPPPESTTPPPPPNTPPRRRWLAVRLAALLPIALVGGTVYAYVTWWDPSALQTLADLRNPGPSAAASSPTVAASPLDPQPTRLRPGRDYYVFLRTVEFYPTQADGDKWDAIGNAAPDIRYSLVWQDNVVYTSDVRDDTLIGVWDPINIDVASAMPLLGEGKLELASTLNQGAIVNVTDDGTLTINLWDQDTVGFGSDPAGQIVLPLADLIEGENTLHFEQTDDLSVKRIVLGTTDTADTVKNLVEALSQP